MVDAMGTTSIPAGMSSSDAISVYMGMRSHSGRRVFTSDATAMVGMVTTAIVMESAAALLSDVDATTTGASSKPPTKTGLRVMMPLNLCSLFFLWPARGARVATFSWLKVDPP